MLRAHVIHILRYILFFYANDHEPIHVHVKYGEYATVFELVFDNGKLIDIIERENTNGLPPQEYKKAVRLIKKKNKDIAEKWYQFHILKKQIKPQTLYVL